MFRKGERKHMATMIAHKMANGGETYREAPEHDGAEKDMDSVDVMVEELMHALETKDHTGVREALESIVEECMSKEDEHEDEGGVPEQNVGPSEPPSGSTNIP